MKNNLTRDNTYILAKFGEKVREYRKIKNMTQIDLAEEVDIDSRHLHRIEKGSSNTSIIVAFSIAKALDVTIDELFNFSLNEK